MAGCFTATHVHCFISVFQNDYNFLLNEYLVFKVL